MSRHEDIDALLGDREEPKGWDRWSRSVQLEYVASRMLAEEREGITSYNALRELGVLSEYQYQRRIDREVYGRRYSVGLEEGLTRMQSPGMFRRSWHPKPKRPNRESAVVGWEGSLGFSWDSTFTLRSAE